MAAPTSLATTLTLVNRLQLVSSSPRCTDRSNWPPLGCKKHRAPAQRGPATACRQQRTHRGRHLRQNPSTGSVPCRHHGPFRSRFWNLPWYGLARSMGSSVFARLILFLTYVLKISSVSSFVLR